MANPELVKSLDFILNRCDDAEIEILAAAVVRRKRDLQLFANSGMPDPGVWARETAASLTTESCGVGIDSVRRMVRDMVMEMLSKEAPELNDEEREELMAAWLPGEDSEVPRLPSKVVTAMVEQFVAFSHGVMDDGEDAALRDQFGSWPERYWQAFPAVVRQVISMYLEGQCDEKEFRAKLITAVEMSCAPDAPSHDDGEGGEDVGKKKSRAAGKTGGAKKTAGKKQAKRDADNAPLDDTRIGEKKKRGRPPARGMVDALGSRREDRKRG